ncbi:hypothetical protein JCGZ_25366 [Jatropha curcas]|uniref:Uncharacterized protein n=1 Tax=Jatropha curcas TaxID=180498 RepID=A0A067JMC9_JATCU|nr:hypothetical protein JCGZ_25366 [Jatropha curcas]
MEAVASVILEKLADELTEAIKNQAQYAIDFKSDLKNLKDKLKIVNGFFADMDKLKEKKQVLEVALSQLRDLAYDADDILTDCMIREEYKKDGHCFSLNDPIFGLMFLPQGIGRLTKLEELSGFKLHRRENSQSCGLLELQNLVQLRVLRIKLSDESEILDNEWEALSRLEKLQVLAIDTENTKEPTNLQKLDRLKPPPGLEQVYLRHYRRNHLPEWINPKTLSKLQYLSIEFGDIKHICPNLELREEKWKLVGLCLKFLPLFEDDWKKLKQIMPSLCDVEVSNCPSLKNPPYEDKSWTSRNLLT